MKKIFGLMACALLATSLVFVGCSGDDDDNNNGTSGTNTESTGSSGGGSGTPANNPTETTDYGAAAAIDEIKALLENVPEDAGDDNILPGVTFSSLTFSSFSTKFTPSSEDNPVLYERTGESGNYSYNAVSEADTLKTSSSDTYLIATGLSSVSEESGGAVLWSSSEGRDTVGLLGVRFDSSKAATKGVKQILFRGSAIDTSVTLPTSGKIDIASVKDFIAVTAGSAGTVTASVQNNTVAVNTAVFALIDTDGKILDAVNLTAKSGNTPPAAQPLTATGLTKGDLVLLVYSRNSDETGTTIVNSISAPDAE